MSLIDILIILLIVGWLGGAVFVGSPAHLLLIILLVVLVIRASQ